MTPVGKTRLWRAAIVAILLAACALILVWTRRRPINLHGAVLVQDSDPRKQLPIANVQISADGDLSPHSATSDSYGSFVLPLWKRVRRGHPIVLHLRHPLYHPLDLNDFVQDKLYVIHLVPLKPQVTPPSQTAVRVTNVRVRYTVEAMSELSVGSEEKTFEVQNKGNVPCKRRRPCSPDGLWKATVSSGSLDAGAGRSFRDARVSCIAGPCPFTKIDSDNFSRGGQVITVNVRNWSDTTTFLMEAQVTRLMVSSAEHWSYPAVFGDRFSFTLPADAESVSMEADMDGQTIIFPIGPSLLLSWASCDGGTQNQIRVYRCSLKAGYRFN